MKKNEIKAVIFDVGGVLIEWEEVFRQFFSELGVSDQEWRKAFDADSLLAQTGKMEFDEYIRGVMKRVNKIRYWREFTKLLPAQLKRIEASFDLLEEIKDKFKLAVLTNTEVGVSSKSNKVFDHKKYFEVFIDSSEVGLVKPDPRIYQLTLDKLKVKAAESLFIDDSMVNISGAEKVGIQVFYFKDPAKSVKKIRQRLGLR